MEEITFSEIISYAKIAEDNSKSFYLKAAGVASQSNVKDFLESLAKEEEAHIAHLENLEKGIREKGSAPPVRGEVHTLGYAEYIQPVRLEADATYQEVLEKAMAKERESVVTYEKLSHFVNDEEARKLFSFLANEERRHLKRFEEEYEDLQDRES